MKSRFVAAGLHMLGSAAIIGAFLLVVFYIWYPYPFHIIHAAKDVVSILIAVDLVLGPLLTFVIFNQNKPVKELARDISIIILFQVAALLWGMHVTYQARPLFMAYHDGGFYSVTGQQINIQDPDSSVELPGLFSGPVNVFVEPYRTFEERQKLIQDVIKGKPDVMHRPGRYRDFEDHYDEILSQAIDPAELFQSEEYKKSIENWLEHNNQNIDDCVLYPVYSGFFRAILLMDKQKLSILAMF